MLINFIGTGLFRSGGMRAIFEYCKRLSERKHNVIYYYPLKPYKFTKYNSFSLEYFRRTYWNVKESINKDAVLNKLYGHNFEIKAVPVINNLFIRDADVTVATQWPTSFSVIELNNSKGKKVYYIQDYEIWNSDVARVDLSYKLDLKRVAVSAYLSKLLLDKFGVQSTTIINSVDFDFFDNKKRLYNETKTIAFIDHALKDKGTPIAIEVVKRLKVEFPTLSFICFGLHRFHDIPDFVNFVENPMDNEIREIYSRSDIFLYTSLKEGLGITPAEAMSCKCAVVASKVGAIADYSTHMKSAIHTNPGSIDEAFEGVRYLLENERELKRIAENGYVEVRRKLDWNRSCNLFEEMILKMN